MEMHSVFSALMRRILKKYGTYCLTERGSAILLPQQGKKTKGGILL